MMPASGSSIQVRKNLERLRTISEQHKQRSRESAMGAGGDATAASSRARDNPSTAFGGGVGDSMRDPGTASVVDRSGMSQSALDTQ